MIEPLCPLMDSLPYPERGPDVVTSRTLIPRTLVVPTVVADFFATAALSEMLRICFAVSPVSDTGVVALALDTAGTRPSTLRAATAVRDFFIGLPPLLSRQSSDLIGRPQRSEPRQFLAMCGPRSEEHTSE